LPLFKNRILINRYFYQCIHIHFFSGEPETSRVQ